MVGVVGASAAISIKGFAYLANIAYNIPFIGPGLVGFIHSTVVGFLGMTATSALATTGVILTVGLSATIASTMFFAGAAYEKFLSNTFVGSLFSAIGSGLQSIVQYIKNSWVGSLFNAITQNLIVKALTIVSRKIL